MQELCMVGSGRSWGAHCFVFSPFKQSLCFHSCIFFPTSTTSPGACKTHWAPLWPLGGSSTSNNDEYSDHFFFFRLWFKFFIQSSSLCHCDSNFFTVILEDSPVREGESTCFQLAIFKQKHFLRNSVKEWILLYPDAYLENGKFQWPFYGGIKKILWVFTTFRNTEKFIKTLSARGTIYQVRIRIIKLFESLNYFSQVWLCLKSRGLIFLHVYNTSIGRFRYRATCPSFEYSHKSLY